MNHNTKQSFFNAAKQAGAAKQWAQMKANRRFKRDKSDKQPFKPGKSVLGLSAVSTAIKNEFGTVVSRRERRQYHDVAKPEYRDFLNPVLTLIRRPFTAFYNGEGPVRLEHNIKPSKYAGARG
ncbi:MAG: hypothetical protein ACQEXQ_16140 [Bacillota bacterium]